MEVVVQSQSKAGTRKRARANTLGGGPVVVDQVKRGRLGAGNVDKQPQSADSGPNNAIDMAIDAVITNSQNVHDATSRASDDVIVQLQQEVAYLQATVRMQQETISGLETKFNNFLAAFGIPPVSAAPCTPSSSSSSSSSNQLSGTAPLVAAASDGPAGASNSVQPAPKSRSYSNVVRSIQNAVVAAVYVDQATTDRRSSSFIVHGLPQNSSISDKTVVSELCSRELDIQPEITATKRLGQPVPNKIQPILIHVKHQPVAQSIISGAKTLRQSADEYIKSNVFINAYLTKAQSKAAFDLRQIRRTKIKENSKFSAPSLANNSGSNNFVPGTSLNPTASSYVPSCATTSQGNQ